MADLAAYEPLAVVPRIAVRFPLVLPLPDGFDPANARSWPSVPGRLEYVGKELLYMSPCADEQQQTAVDVVTELNLWCRTRQDFVVGGNEAGMLLAGEVRAADVAVWRRADLPGVTGSLPRVAPVLAVEVAGQDEGAAELTVKAHWYLSHGVEVFWLVFPAAREVQVVTNGGTKHFGADAVIDEYPALPGLSCAVAGFFRQLR